jgi:hypothetical protein
VQRLASDSGRRRQRDPAAHGRVEHPLRNLKRTAIVVRLEHAAIQRMLAPCNADYENRATVPRMPAIENYPRLGNMGVLSSICTTRGGATRSWAT